MNRRASDVLGARDREAVAAAARLVRERFSAERVVLYGSKARGADDAESDIDLLVLTSRPLDWRERGALTDALFDIGLAHGVVISALTISEAEWESGRISVLPIRDEIRRTGVPV